MNGFLLPLLLVVILLYVQLFQVANSGRLFYLYFFSPEGVCPNWQVCVYMYVCGWACVCMHVCTHMYIVHECLHVCKCVCACMCVSVHAYLCICVCILKV